MADGPVADAVGEQDAVVARGAVGVRGVADDLDDPRERDDAGDVGGSGDEDRRHLDAAIAMVAAGASRWVMVCGIRNANDLAERFTTRRRQVVIRALTPTSILVARADPVPQPVASRPPESPFRGRLAHVAHAVAAILR
jgi:hypothetical protein